MPEKTALVLAPHGRDAAVAVGILREAEIAATAVADLAELASRLRSGAGYAIVTEDALRGADLRDVAGFIADQKEWSDFPFIVLTARGGGLERNPAAVRLLEALGNVTFLERPFHPTTLVSLARSALRARERQYKAQVLLDDVREGQDRMRVALAAGGLGAWSLVLKTNELSTSPDCRAQFGRGEHDPLSYDDLVAAIHPDDLDRMQAAVRVSIESGEDYDIQYRCIWPDRSLHWVQVNGRLERDRRGKPLRMVGVSHDITARKQTENRRTALLTLGDRLRQLTAPADMSFLAAEILGTTLGVSRAGYGVIDRARETIAIERDWNSPGTQTIAGILHFREYGSYIDDLKRGVVAVVEDARTDPRTAATAAALEAIHARSFINMPLVDDGKFVALLYLNHKDERAWSAEEIAFVRDVADRTQAAIERRIAETSLAELAASLERQVEERTRERDRTWLNSQDLLAVVSAEGTFHSVNPAWTAVLGWQPEHLVGRNYIEFSHPDDRAASAAAHERARTDVLRQYENRLLHADGGYRWISWVASAEGDMVYASGRHVTAEKEAQLQLEATQEQLRQAQKMEAVGQLTGGLAHDFNNLLTGMTGGLELMQKRIRQGRIDEIDKYIDMAQAAAKRAAALTHRLLAFSRRQTLDPRPTQINRLIAGMEEFLQRSIGPAIELVVAGEENLWTTLIDPNQLENALLNLCLNARDAMPEGGRITISASNRVLDPARASERDLPAGQYVALTVADTGTGMDAETVARAFDPFFTTKPLGEGTGLGLSMIYGFVRQSGGQVRIHSAPGEGTRVVLYLPHVASIEDESPALEDRAEAPPSDQGEVVLVVDDEPAVRALVVDVLADLGYDAIEAEDGNAGLAVLKSPQRIDLLITDVGLPKGMNGRQLADAARVRRPDLKVLFITGYAENAVIGNERLAAGMHILTKPFAIDALADRIRELVVGR
jgi:PAS domain S-box-containing protein